MSIEDKAGPTVSATSEDVKLSMSAGSVDRPTTSNTPTKMDATKAPRIDPIPPMTITTKAKINMSSPMPDSTEMRGAAIRPASPAKNAPMPKIIVYSKRILTPKARTMGPLLAPARMSIPVRVLEMNK